MPGSLLHPVAFRTLVLYRVVTTTRARDTCFEILKNFCRLLWCSGFPVWRDRFSVQRMKWLKRLVGVHDRNARCFKGSKPLQMLPNFANIYRFHMFICYTQSNTLKSEKINENIYILFLYIYFHYVVTDLYGLVTL
ncbi:hypothetical protein NC651_036976 [Populus alba x Populus x berolinensis]|nr:hypothetical protein NC651_036976 [Populus alba x Populus x berolinensis]